MKKYAFLFFLSVEYLLDFVLDVSHSQSQR